MKKILGFILVVTSLATYAVSSIQPSDSNTSVSYQKMMYFDFGLGLGGAEGLNGSSIALNAMTMGGYFNKNFGVEIGMDVLPDASNNAGEAMTMTYHLAAKGILPLSEIFSLYGKAGLGVNQYEGEVPSSLGMTMVNQASLGLYTAAGVQFNFNQNFALYLEGSGVVIPMIGSNGNVNNGSFGSTYMGTLGLEVKI